jgi:hypothetical protein
MTVASYAAYFVYITHPPYWRASSAPFTLQAQVTVDILTPQSSGGSQHLHLYELRQVTQYPLCLIFYVCRPTLPEFVYNR